MNCSSSDFDVVFVVDFEQVFDQWNYSEQQNSQTNKTWSKQKKIWKM